MNLEDLLSADTPKAWTYRVINTEPSHVFEGDDPFTAMQLQIDCHGYTMADAIRKVTTPALIICGDEDDACVEPSLFLKKHLAASGLTFFPKSGHVLNLEEPALFNEMVERFIALVEAGRWGPRDPRSVLPH